MLVSLSPFSLRGFVQLPSAIFALDLVNQGGLVVVPKNKSYTDETERSLLKCNATFRLLI